MFMFRAGDLKNFSENYMPQISLRQEIIPSLFHIPTPMQKALVLISR